MLNNGIFAGHVVCLTVLAETATYSKALTLYIYYVLEQRPPVNKGHFYNSLWLTVVDMFDCMSIINKVSKGLLISSLFSDGLMSAKELREN